MSPRTGVGILLPSANRALEPDAAQVCSPDVSFHFQRMALASDTEAEIASLAAAAVREAPRLLEAGVSVLGFGCTSGAFIGGPAYENELVDRLSEAAGLPVASTSLAVRDALRRLGARRVVLVSPYLPWLATRGIDYLASDGVTVVAEFSWEQESGPGIAAITPAHVAYEAIRLAHAHDDVQAVVALCTGLRALEAVDQIEAATSLPVVTSNQALLWRLGELVGSPQRIPGRLAHAIPPSVTNDQQTHGTQTRGTQ